MPHAALWVVQRFGTGDMVIIGEVSMPHAALWVVQPSMSECVILLPSRFNAARGFVGGAAIASRLVADRVKRFQCRTRLCGWCSFVARSPCPPKGKKPFWKVSGNLRCLTENM